MHHVIGSVTHVKGAKGSASFAHGSNRLGFDQLSQVKNEASKLKNSFATGPGMRASD
jgi:hypothetical protein